MPHTSTHARITQNVRALYESFPYPGYPLFPRPRWQEGVLGLSAFAQRLILSTTGAKKNSDLPRKILLAGSGEMQPYILRKLEPKNHTLVCVDLSRKSLMRARMRLALETKATTFLQEDLYEYLFKTKDTFDHIESYGVLHHLSDPSLFLKLVFSKLNPQGTMRIMVYNSPARWWIHEMQKIFQLCKLTTHEDDLVHARRILLLLSEVSPFLKEKMEAIGWRNLQKNSFFVDAFFHPREARIGPKKWGEIFASQGFSLLGIFDRYGELDGIPNPLFVPPDLGLLEEKAQSGEFSGPLEFFFYKSPNPTIVIHRTSSASLRVNFTKRRSVGDFLKYPYYLYTKSPPSFWFDWDETSSISFLTRFHLWFSFLEEVSHPEKKKNYEEKFLDAFSLPTLQRLTRLGVLFPEKISNQSLREKVIQPMDEVEIEVREDNNFRNYQLEEKVFLEIQKIMERRVVRKIERRLKILKKRIHLLSNANLVVEGLM